METNDIDLQALKNAAQDATPGPWHIDGRMVGTLATTICLMCEGDSFGGIHEAHNANANAAFLTAANPAVVLALIERLERAEAAAANAGGKALTSDERVLFEKWSAEFHSEIPGYAHKYPEQSSSEWNGWVARSRLAMRELLGQIGAKNPAE